MTQRLDDVTGDPIRLSARQREQQREATIATVNQIILQLNHVTAAVRSQADALEVHDAAIVALQRQHATWLRLTVWQRVKALVVGVPHE